MSYPIIGRPETYGKQYNRPNTPVPVDMSNGPAIPDLYDSERIEVDQLMRYINNKARSGSINLNNFVEEIKDRFLKLNLVVKVRLYEVYDEKTDETLYYKPSIEIHSRVEEKEFDHDRQQHEVVNDILGTGTKGWINTSSQGNSGAGGH